MKKFTLCLLCALMLVGLMPFSSAAAAKDAPVLESAQMGILYEETTDTILVNFNGDKKNVPASLTKVMTAILVLEHDPELAGTTTVSEAAISDEYCNWKDDFYLQAGEEVRVKDLMNYLLIVSGNEAATVLAEYVAGNIPAFLNMMNAKAKALGMKDTIYFDPHGLSPNNMITCEDMLILCREAMKNETFRSIVCQSAGTLPKNNIRRLPHTYKTTNRLIRHNGTPGYVTDYSKDILGIKTGSTKAAGLNFACCMKKDELRFYSVVMHAGTVVRDGEEVSGHFTDTVKLLDYARTYSKAGFSAGETVGKIRTQGSLLKNLTVSVKEDLFTLAQGELQVELIAADDLGKAVKQGDIVGKAVITDDFGNTKEVNLIAAADASTNVLQYALVVVPVIAVVAIVVLVLKKRKQGAKA